MLKLGYIIANIKEKIWCNHEILYDYYRRGGVTIGSDVYCVHLR